MKFAFIALIFALSGMFLFAGCAQDGLSGEVTSALFEQWIQKAMSITSEQSEFTGFVEVTSGGRMVSRTELNGTSYVKNDDVRQDVEVVQQGRTIALRTYMTNGSIYTCPITNGKFNCTKLQNYDAPTTKQQLEMFNGIYSKGAFVFESALNKTVLGHRCIDLKMVANLPKFSQAEKEFVALANGLPKDQISAITSFKLGICVVPETSENYESDLLTTISGKEVRIYTAIKNSQQNVQFPAGIFELPAQ